MTPFATQRRASFRHLSVFFVLGIMLFGVKAALRSAPEPPRLFVQVAPQASQEEIERAIDEAVLVDQSLSRGGALLDPIVRDQVLRSMHIATGPQSESEQALLDRGLSLGLHRADPLIRKRLAFQAEQVLRGRLHAPQADEAELERYLQQHAERYRQAERLSLSHIFISRGRHPEDLADVVERMKTRLQAEAPRAQEAARYSEPTLVPLMISRATTTELAARFGEEFARDLTQAPMQTWHGPLTSSYGAHFVFLIAREPERLGALGELRERLVLDRERDLMGSLVAQEVRTLRESYRVEIVRAPAR